MGTRDRGQGPSETFGAIHLFSDVQVLRAMRAVCIVSGVVAASYGVIASVSAGATTVEVMLVLFVGLVVVPIAIGFNVKPKAQEDSSAADALWYFAVMQSTVMGLLGAYGIGSGWSGSSGVLARMFLIMALPNLLLLPIRSWCVRSRES
jgi:hypothetical protein